MQGRSNLNSAGAGGIEPPVQFRSQLGKNPAEFTTHPAREYGQGFREPFSEMLRGPL